MGQGRESLYETNKRTFGIVLVGLVGLFAILSVVYAVRGIGPPVSKSHVLAAAVPSFTTLRQNVTGRGAWLDLCVDSNITRSQARALVEYLYGQYYSDKSIVVLNVFNDPSAVEHRDDPNYPAKKYASEWLAQLQINKTTGYSRIDTSGGL